MKITWSKLTPEERDKAVCEAVGIEGVKWWCVKDEGKTIQTHLRSEGAAWSRIGVGPFGNNYLPDVYFEYPKVSTDANEAVKVWKSIDGSLSMGPQSDDTWCSEVRIDGIPKYSYGTFCHAICIAALRAKRIEVEL